MRRVCIAALLASLAAGAVQAAEPKPAAAEKKPAAEKDVEPIDADFLEFLGSLDAEGEEWREFLEMRPVNDSAGKKEPKQEKVKKP